MGLERIVGALLTLLLAVWTPAASPLGGEEDNLGARALHEDSWSTPQLGLGDITRGAPVVPMTPPMEDLLRTPRYYAEGCHVPVAGTEVVPGCSYGDRDSDVQVAVLGSSKVGQYFPAIEEIALREGWRLRMYTKSGCDFVVDSEPTAGYPQCDDYNEALVEHLEEHPPDLVITGGRRKDAAGYENAWRFLEGLGVEQIGVLWDTPGPDPNPRACIADALQSGADLTTCATPIPDSRSGNPSLQEAVRQVDSAHFVNLRDWVCPVSQLSPLCAGVLGRAQIYADGSHMAQVYAETLTDPIHQRLYEAGIATYRPSVDRVAGSDRYATAALLSLDTAPGGRVLIASGRDYPDALAAAAKAGHTESAVLLTRRDSLPSETRDALRRLQPSEIVVAGGQVAVSDDVLEELGHLSSSVRRVEGADRYETAAAIGTLAPMRTGGTVYVATGTGFADALAAAAQAGQRGAPILLVRPGSVPGATAQALEELRPHTIVVAGGEKAVSGEVEEELGDYATSVVRRAGADRYATAAALAQDTAPGRVIHVAVGTGFADSLAAAPAAAAAQGAVLIVRPDGVPLVTSDAVRDLDPEQVVLVGGPAAVTEPTKRTLLRLAS